MREKKVQKGDEEDGKKYLYAEEIVNLLRQVKWRFANGKMTPQSCKEAGIVEQTYYRWRKEYDGLKVDQAQAAEGTGAGKREAETVANLRRDKHLARGPGAGKFICPERRCRAVNHARQSMGSVSGMRASW